MSHIFISYSQLNRDYARVLADQLLARGYDVWIDDRIDYGEDWWREIVRAIKMCAVFVVIMTPESGESRWVQREVTLADELRKPTFPLLLAGDLINSDYWAIFVRSQYADVRDGRLPPEVFFERIAGYAMRRAAGGREVVNTLPGTGQLPLTGPLGGAVSPPPALTLPADFAAPDVLSILPEPFAWCEIPAGKVVLEDVSGGGGTRGGSYEVSRFFMSRYPVTNAHFEEFVIAGDGFREPAWWDFSPEADQWRKGVARSKDSGSGGFNAPRTRVCWYEAVAFCRWLTARVQLPRGIAIALPTEQQWQRAAQGDDDRMFPWGNRFDPSRCNTSEAGLEKPTPVNRFPNGVSPFGVLDMSGNVQEWCLTAWATDRSNLLGAIPRVVRGGSWNQSGDDARVTCRDADFPESRTGRLGFRVVCAAAVG